MNLYCISIRRYRKPKGYLRSYENHAGHMRWEWTENVAQADLFPADQANRYARHFQSTRKVFAKAEAVR